VSRYYKVSDGERMRVPKSGAVRIRCCDCSLIHLFRFEVIDGQVEVTAWRDQKATAAIRKRLLKRIK
jgi:hypothetical protein